MTCPDLTDRESARQTIKHLEQEAQKAADMKRAHDQAVAQVNGLLAERHDFIQKLAALLPPPTIVVSPDFTLEDHFPGPLAPVREQVEVVNTATPMTPSPAKVMSQNECFGETEADLLRRKVAALETENTNLSTQVRNLRTQLAGTEEHCAKLRGDITSMTTARTALEDRFSGLAKRHEVSVHNKKFLQALLEECRAKFEAFYGRDRTTPNSLPMLIDEAIRDITLGNAGRVLADQLRSVLNIPADQNVIDFCRSIQREAVAGRAVKARVTKALSEL